MSLINDLLTDLEKRRGGHRDQQTVFAGLAPVADDDLDRGRRHRTLAVVVVVLLASAIAGAGYVWLNQDSGGGYAAGPAYGQVAMLENLPPEPAAEAVAGAKEPSGENRIEPSSEADLKVAGRRIPLRMDTALSAAERVPAAADSAPEPVAATPGRAEPEPDPGPSALKQVNVDERDDAIRLEFNLAGEPQYRSYLLADPHRMVVEFDHTDYALAGEPAAGRHIRRVRNSRHGSALRVVLDLNAPVEITDSRFLTDAGSSQLLISLAPQTADTDSAVKEPEPAIVADAGIDVAAKADAEQEPEVRRNRQMYMRPRSEAAAATDEDDYRRGLRHYNRTDFRRSIDALADAVRKNPRHDRAQYLLASALLQINERAAAEAQLEQALRDLPDHADLRRLYAHLLIERGDLNGALSVLQQSPPGITEAPDFHALLAAVHQKLDDHEQAVRVYRRLVEITPTNGVLWMGLGISLEALAQSAEALAAYRRALDGGTLTADLRRFVSDRIQSLSGEEKSS